MKVIGWGVKIQGYGYAPHNRPQIVCIARMECILCEHPFNNSATCELWPWETRNLANLRMVAEHAFGTSGGLFCPHCGNHSRVVEPHFEWRVGEVRKLVTTDAVQFMVADLGLEEIDTTRREPILGEHVPEKAYATIEDAELWVAIKDVTQGEFSL